MYDWGAEGRIEKLRELAAQGLSAGQIAREFDGTGLTRSAILSRMRRSNIPLSTQGRKKFQPPPVEPEPPVATPVSTLNLQRGMCKWPTNDGPDWLHCGAPTYHGPYCREHNARSYSKSHRDEAVA